MRSPSSPESNDSKEHQLLDTVESGAQAAGELALRKWLMQISENNMREDLYPELYPRRFRNMQLLFDLLRSNRTPHSADFWLEARLLRLMEKHDQCRQLCQTQPMHEWAFATLQEYVWAGRRDSHPYHRYSEFESAEDAQVAAQLFAAAKTLYEAKCFQWQQAHDAAARPTHEEQKLSRRNSVGLVLTLGFSVAAWYFFGWLPALGVFTIGSWLNFIVQGDSNVALGLRMNEWVYNNPRPVDIELTLHHRPEMRAASPIGYPDAPD